jgi:phosphomannomutase
MAESGLSLAALVDRQPRYSIVKEKLDRPPGALTAVYAALRQGFPDATVDTQDGIRLAWPDRWVHVRPSGTEPIVRVIAEAPTAAEARSLIAQARASFS